MDEVGSAIQIERAYLEDLLRKSWGSKEVQIGDWKVSRLSGGLELGSAIYRLQGRVEAAGESRAWSLILKTIQPELQHDDPQGYRYWKREAEAYQSGWLGKLPGPVTAPCCYEVCERADGSVWIWLEDVKDEVGHPWPIEHYRLVASRLGRFNGAYLAGGNLPSDPWMTHDWLRKYLEHAAPMVTFMRENPAHADVQSMFPGMALPLTLAMWDEREQMMKVLDDLPQTFCHQDAFGRNLFSRGEQVVAIDWGYAGIAPVGAELAPLIGAAFGLAGAPSSQARSLDEACFEGYLEGLGEAGWRLDRRQVRMGYTLTVLLRYVLGATVGELLPGLLDEKIRQQWADGLGVSAEKAGESDPGVVAYLQSIAQEALKLLGLGSMRRVVGWTIRYSITLNKKRKKP